MVKINIPGWQNTARLVLITVSVLIAIKFVFPLLIPFIIAFIIATMINPAVLFLNKHTHINKNILTTFFIILILFLICVLFFILLYKLNNSIINFFNNYDIYEVKINLVLSELCNTIQNITGVSTEQISTLFTDTINSFMTYLEDLLLPTILQNAIDCVKEFFEFFGFMFIVIISVYLIVKDFKEIKCYIIDSYYGNKIYNVLKNLKSAGKGYIKAQSIIMMIIIIVAAIVFLFLKINHAIILAVILGILDTLPLIGSGLFLVPCSIIYLLMGNYWNSALFFILYIICSVIREMLEPKLIGKKLSIHPIIVLISVFAGIKLFGLAGFLYGPLSYIIINELYKEFQEIN